MINEIYFTIDNLPFIIRNFLLGMTKMSCDPRKGEATRRRVGLLRQYLSELPRPWYHENSAMGKPASLQRQQARVVDRLPIALANQV